MGRNIPIVSFICGVIFRRKRQPVEEDGDYPHQPETPTYSAPSTPTATSGGGHSPEYSDTKPGSPEPHHQPLPPPPGGGNYHMRTVSCGHNHHHRSISSVTSKLVSSMSLRVMGGGGAAAEDVDDDDATGFYRFGPGPVRENRPRHREGAFKYFKREDSVWKKTIILGEKCRVRDEDDDDIHLYDEKGNKITSYHPKTHSGLLQQYSRQNMNSDHEE